MASDQMLIPFHSGNDSEKKKRDYKKCKYSSFPTSRKSKKGTKTAGNPFSDRGLDKFEELLADIEKKKKMIHSKVGPEDVYYVSFKYSPSNDCVPVLVKLKDRNGQEVSKKNTKTADFKDDKKDSNNFGAHETKVLDKSPRKESSTPVERIEKGSCWNLMLNKWRRPSFYMPVILILILLLLLFFGRSVVTLYISIGWYVLPTMISKKPLKKKIYKRGFSELKMASEGLSSPKISKTNAPPAKLKFFQNQKSF
ncbi:hypothetical protein K2173_028422 [Erythroxylum novogranatense]|uniref:ZCF37 n=1 Tax=Erythroxylum novogranatense TaxID=1862640 RepID=A0AAV8U1Y8_9ROSI|nr:hypothetical protein K2173_028422 [Erythroxylum novogranatense]